MIAEPITKQEVMTEQEAMEVLVGAALELASIKWRYFEPGAPIPPGIKAELQHRARLLEAAKVAQGLTWWQDNG